MTTRLGGLVLIVPGERMKVPANDILLRARPPLMAQFEIGGRWYRDGFDPDLPSAAGVLRTGIPLWFDEAPVYSGIDWVSRAAGHGLHLYPSHTQVVALVRKLEQRGLGEAVVDTLG